MDDKPKRATRLPAPLILASFIIIVAGMKAASSLLVPFFLAAFIAVLCTPPLFWLRRKGVPKVPALAIILLAILAVGLLFGALIGPSLSRFLDALPVYQEQLSAHVAASVGWLRDHGIDIPQDEAAGTIDPGWVMGLAGAIFEALSGVLTGAVLIVLAVVFILLEVADFPRKLQLVLRSPEKSLSAIEKFGREARRYLVIKTLLSVAEAVLIWVWLLILGVDYPVLWAALVFLLNYVPNIGSIVAALPPVLLALVQLGVGSALLTALGFIVANTVLGNIVEPKVMGKGLSLSTLVVFLSMVFWGWVLGPIGMILSVPMTILVKILLEAHEETRGLAILLGSATEKT